MQIWTKTLSTTLFSLVDDHNENLNDILLISLYENLYKKLWKYYIFSIIDC